MYYAYKRNPPSWLKTEVILNQFHTADNHRACRLKVQRYSDEQNSVWEDVKHGLIYGSQKFVDKIKSRFISNRTDVELSQYNSLFGEYQCEAVLKKASKILDFDPESFRQTKWISPADKDKRDLVIYFFWETGKMTNQKIGTLFGLTYSPISLTPLRRDDLIEGALIRSLGGWSEAKRLCLKGHRVCWGERAYDY